MVMIDTMVIAIIVEMNWQVRFYFDIFDATVSIGIASFCTNRLGWSTSESFHYFFAIKYTFVIDILTALVFAFYYSMCQTIVESVPVRM